MVSAYIIIIIIIIIHKMHVYSWLDFNQTFTNIFRYAKKYLKLYLLIWLRQVLRSNITLTFYDLLLYSL